jgi:hypothetical protein
LQTLSVTAVKITRHTYQKIKSYADIKTTAVRITPYTDHVKWKPHAVKITTVKKTIKVTAVKIM